MKSYPSITQYSRAKIISPYFHTWDKVDGSNLRFEYSSKQGWYKFGTRTRLFDQNDEVFGQAIPLFFNTLAPQVDKIIAKEKIKQLIIFCEFAGKESFAGKHVADDPKELFLLDAAVNKQGILSPNEFLRYFGECKTPHYFGLVCWTQPFIESVKRSELFDMTFEGVVGKQGSKHAIQMVKLKSHNWIDKVRALYNNKEAEQLINS